MTFPIKLPKRLPKSELDKIRAMREQAHATFHRILRRASGRGEEYYDEKERAEKVEKRNPNPKHN